MLRRLLPLLLLAITALAGAQERIKDVIYMKQGGAAFTMDVFKPKTPNGAAVIWLISGGWFSKHEDINVDAAKGLNDLGYTVFEVVHGSQPKYTIPEIAPMITRAVRFVHANAAVYGVDDNRIALIGSSAGGHLSLLTAAKADNGNPSATDPVDRAPSSVKTVAVFFPPTDFTHWGAGTGELNVDDPKFLIFKPAFGIPPGATKEALAERAKNLSPMTFMTAAMPPTLLMHGDKDLLVPLQQSEILRDKLKELGVKVELVTVAGGGHDGVTVNGGLPRLVTWLNEQLGK